MNRAFLNRRAFLERMGMGSAAAGAVATGALAYSNPASAQTIATNGPLNLKDFGATGDGVTLDDAAVATWLSKLTDPTLKQRAGYVPTGNYRLSARIMLDLDQVKNAGILIFGDGMQSSVFNFTTSSVTSGPQFWAYAGGGSPANLKTVMHFSMRDLGFMFNCDGPGMMIGQDGYPDAFNESNFTNIYIQNFKNSASAVALKLNQVIASSFTNLIADGGSTSNGVGLQIAQTGFSTFTACSFGIAGIAVHITGGFSYGNVFNSVNIEMVNHAIVQDSTAAQHNTFIGGTISGWNSAGGVYAIL